MSPASLIYTGQIPFIGKTILNQLFLKLLIYLILTLITLCTVFLFPKQNLLLNLFKKVNSLLALMSKENLTRVELYDLLWRKPLAFASLDCAVSMPVIRQICMDNNIPLPWEGYRRGKEHNEPVPLPPVNECQSFDFCIAASKAVASLVYSNETEASFHVPSKLVIPHILVGYAQKSITQDHHFYGMSHMLRTGIGQLNVRASEKNITRAFCITDTFLKVFDARGYHIFNQDKETVINVRKVRFTISIRELSKSIPPKSQYASRSYEPTGQLAFRLDGWTDREWKDGKSPLENNCKEIVDHMEVAARDLERHWADNKVREKERIEKAKNEAQLIISDVAENAAFELLLQEASRWHELNILDKYLDSLSHNILKSPAFSKWLDWARHRRKIFDPINQKRLEF